MKSWDEKVGVLYDLGYRLDSRLERDETIRTHYAHTLSLLSKIVFRSHPGSVIDYGCGPGILTEHVKKSVGESVAVVGAEIRDERLTYNRLVSPDIHWCQTEEVFSIEVTPPCVVVLDGVVNYMPRGELVRLLGIGDFFLFYYASTDDRGRPLFADFDVFDVLHGAGFQEYSVQSIDRGDAPPHVLFEARRRHLS
jgi:SAM-dependent methyltransferase